jgi:hypothetical protein
MQFATRKAKCFHQPNDIAINKTSEKTIRLPAANSTNIKPVMPIFSVQKDTYRD